MNGTEEKEFPRVYPSLAFFVENVTQRAAWRGCFPPMRDKTVPLNAGRRNPSSLLRRPAKKHVGYNKFFASTDGYGGRAGWNENWRFHECFVSCGSSLFEQNPRSRVPRKTIEGLRKWAVQTCASRNMDWTDW